jgi:predicted permease
MKMLSEILRDLRFAARTLAKSPGFTVVAVLTLALGIGANTAIFSVVDGVLLRPAPFASPDELVMVWETDRNTGTMHEPASLPDFLDFKAGSRSFAALSAFAGGTATVGAATGEPFRVPLLASTHDFLPMLGVVPVLGRAFTESESRPGGGRVLAISESLWERLFARDPLVLGRTLDIDGAPYEIVAVLPDAADFGLHQVLDAADYARGFADGAGRQRVALWLPLQRSVEEWPRGRHSTFVLGRLAPGASLAVAREELTRMAADLEAAWPANDGRGVHLEPLPEVVFAEARPALLLLTAAVGLVLLVTCANVANLALARAVNRSRELAIRASLGAGGARLTRLILVESVLLSLVGGALGVALAWFATEVLLALAPADIPRLEAVGIDLRVLCVTAAAAIAVGIGFGLAPASHVRRADPQAVLRSEAAGGVGGHRGRLQSALVVAELALAVILVVGAGLLLRSFWEIRQVDPGFRPDGVLKAEFDLPASRYPVDYSAWPELEFAAMHRFNVDLLERLRTLPGVESVALAAAHPLERGGTTSFTIAGREAEAASWPEISTRHVSPGYFATVGLPLLAGRGFTAGDDASALRVTVINESAARLLFPDRDPVGQYLSFWGERRIVGVVADEKLHGLTAQAPIAAYTPLAQFPSMGGHEVVLLRAAGDAEDLAALLRQAIHDLDQGLAVFGVEPLAATVGRSVATERFTMLLLGTFAAAAIALAAIGVHGVLTCVVGRRTAELGLRMALGATRGDVLRLVAGQGAVLALLGLALGLAGALAATRLLDALLFGVTPTDPATFVAVAAVVFAVAMLSALLPARRAASVAPLEALRHD